MKALRLSLLLALPVAFILGQELPARATVSDEIPAALAQVLETAAPALEVAGNKPAEIEGLRAFYQQRGNQPVWVDRTGAAPRARRLLLGFQNAARDGLDPANYDYASALQEAGTPEQMATAELTVSAALLRYASDLRGGRALSARILRDPRIVSAIDPVQVLTAAADAPDPATFVDSLAPADPIYVGLRDALARYRAIAAAGGWPQLPDGPDLTPGSTDPRVSTLRLRLQLTGDLAADAQGAVPSHYDKNVDEAVRRFQRRHGLSANGIVNGQTQALLNVPVQGRIRQILANLERARWLPDDLGNPYVLVKSCGFSP